MNTSLFQVKSIKTNKVLDKKKERVNFPPLQQLIDTVSETIHTSSKGQDSLLRYISILSLFHLNFFQQNSLLDIAILCKA